jgi:hypothetical protein
MGRPRKFATNADRQRAYRERPRPQDGLKCRNGVMGYRNGLRGGLINRWTRLCNDSFVPLYWVRTKKQAEHGWDGVWKVVS